VTIAWSYRECASSKTRSFWPGRQRPARRKFAKPLVLATAIEALELSQYPYCTTKQLRAGKCTKI
jgi:hypothetical protein